jgi:hypothetical protein
MRPDTVIPGSVSGELVLIRAEQVALAIGGIRSYPNGFEFTVHTRLRRVDPAVRPSADPFDWHRQGYGAKTPDEALRLGIMYSDGRRTATTSGHRPCRDTGGDELILQQNGGGGDERAWDQDFWVHPLPPEGPVTLVASWLAYGVTEARAELDGNAILAAAERAVILWPDEPDVESTFSERRGTITAGRPTGRTTSPRRRTAPNDRAKSGDRSGPMRPGPDGS